MNFILFVLIKWCKSDNTHFPSHHGFNSIKLKPKETIQFKNINPQSIFLFTNPDPRLFKLELFKNNEFVSEPFINNAPILDLIKTRKKSDLNNDIPNNNLNHAFRNSRLLSENLDENNRNNDNIDNSNGKVSNNNINQNTQYIYTGNRENNNQNIINRSENTSNYHQVYSENSQINNGNNQINNPNNNENINTNQNNQINNQDNNNNKNNQINTIDNNDNLNNPNHKEKYNTNQISNQNNQNTNSNTNNQNNNEKSQINNNNPNNQINGNNSNDNQNKDNKKHVIDEKDLIFGIYIGLRSHEIRITALDSNDLTTTINFYYLAQRNNAHQIYLSTYPNDIFGIGKSPEGFDVCKIFIGKLISYWNVPGETIYYETTAINQSRKGKVTIMNDDQNILTYPSVKSLHTTKSEGDYLYFDWISEEYMKNSFYKLLIRNQKTVSDYIDKYRSEDMDRYSTALNENKFNILPPTRFQFIRPAYIKYITAKHRYGQFSRKKDVIPLTSLNELVSSSLPYKKIAIITLVVLFFLVLIILSVIDKIQSVSYSTGFGAGKKRKVKHRKLRRDHKNIKDPQNGNTFGFDYMDGNRSADEIDEEEEDDIDDGNLSLSKKKKRSPEMNGIMEKILVNKK